MVVQGVHLLQKCALLQFLDRKTEYVGKFLVDLYKPTSQVRNGHSDSRLVENGTEPNVAFTQRRFGFALRCHVVKNHDHARERAASIPNGSSGVFYRADGPVATDKRRICDSDYPI